MRYTFGLVAALSWALAGVSPARSEEPDRDFLKKLERQVQVAMAAAEPSIACIVVSRSELYPRASTEAPGKLGEFDPQAFLKTDKSIERLKLSKRLDLSYEEGIPNHGYIGGVVIDSSGLVLTPYHAIEGATKIYVYLPSKNGVGAVGSYADIHAADARSDLAVLKLIHPPENLKPIAFAKVRMELRGTEPATIFKGKLIGLMANPYISNFKLGGASFSYGSITNIRVRLVHEGPATPPLSDSLYRYGRFLEFSVLSKENVKNTTPSKPVAGRTETNEHTHEKMNELVTGGVLINLDGEMVGMTVASAVIYNRTVGPGYALPMDEFARGVIEVLRKGDEVDYGFLGITLEKDQSLTQTKPITIGSVIPYSPADFAGLNRGDVIVAIDGIQSDDYQDLLLYAGNKLSGTKIALTLRGKEKRPVSLTLGKFRNTQPFIASVRPDAVFGLRVDYLSLLVQQVFNQKETTSFNHPAEIPGVCVRELVPNSPAAAKFKTLGDNPTLWFITSVNGTTVSTPAEFYAAAKGQASVKLSVRDWNENRRELTLP